MWDWDDEPTQRRKLSDDTKAELHKAQKRRCMYCGRRLPLADMHLDHKTPLAKRGSNTKGNLQLLCTRCNTRKGSLTDGVFRRRYKLPPSRQAKGPPPKVVRYSHFDQITKERQVRRRRQRRREEDDLWS